MTDINLLLQLQDKVKQMTQYIQKQVIGRCEQSTQITLQSLTLDVDMVCRSCVKRYTSLQQQSDLIIDAPKMQEIEEMLNLKQNQINQLKSQLQRQVQQYQQSQDQINQLIEENKNLTNQTYNKDGLMGGALTLLSEENRSLKLRLADIELSADGLKRKVRAFESIQKAEKEVQTDYQCDCFILQQVQADLVKQMKDCAYYIDKCSYLEKQSGAMRIKLLEFGQTREALDRGFPKFAQPSRLELQKSEIERELEQQEQLLKEQEAIEKMPPAQKALMLNFQAMKGQQWQRKEQELTQSAIDKSLKVAQSQQVVAVANKGSLLTLNNDFDLKIQKMSNKNSSVLERVNKLLMKE